MAEGGPSPAVGAGVEDGLALVGRAHLPGAVRHALVPTAGAPPFHLRQPPPKLWGLLPLLCKLDPYPRSSEGGGGQGEVNPQISWPQGVLCVGGVTTHPILWGVPSQQGFTPPPPVGILGWGPHPSRVLPTQAGFLSGGPIPVRFWGGGPIPVRFYPSSSRILVWWSPPSGALGWGSPPHWGFISPKQDFAVGALSQWDFGVGVPSPVGLAPPPHPQLTRGPSRWGAGSDPRPAAGSNRLNSMALRMVLPSKSGRGRKETKKKEIRVVSEGTKISGCLPPPPPLH